MGQGHIHSRNDVSRACQLERLLLMVTVIARCFILISKLYLKYRLENLQTDAQKYLQDQIDL